MTEDSTPGVRPWSPRVSLFLGALPVLFVTWICFANFSSPAPLKEPDLNNSSETSLPTSSTKSTYKFTNSLVHETSPYLLQHAHNPVNWLPWGEEAFALARKENKPIFLSVGYSTCYWCHVMERESFENEEVAAILNEYYVCIKVDREERPDVDEQYMLATQLTGRGGGWPNSVWLMPDGRPWMAATYFPREQFMQVLLRLAAIWKEHPEAVEKQASAFTEGIKEAAQGSATLAPQRLNPLLVPGLLAHMQEQFDAEHGGFGSRPKFPPHGNLEFLLHLAKVREAFAATDGPAPKEMILQTLDAIWQGGIHDHVGGGFHRYATDERWLLPHFEKMLYDNAQLMRSYTAAYELTKEERNRLAVADIFAWLKREMTDPAGGFYSALDSESEGHEGKSYVWTISELRAVLSETEADLFASVYNFEAAGNFAEERSGERTGANIPHLTQSLAKIAAEHGIPEPKLSAQLAAIREKLLVARDQRVPPHRDDKVLASWNGLMISALAQAGHSLNEPAYTQAAANAAQFVWQEMQHEGALHRSWRAGTAHLPGYLDDYAYLAEGLLELHTSTGDEKWLQRTKILVDRMIADFEDSAGGFFFTSAAHDELLIRSKNVLGGGNLPTANGVAAQVLLRLAEKTGEQRYADSARRTVEALSATINRAPQATEGLVVAAHMLNLSSPSLPRADYEKFPVSVNLVKPTTPLEPGAKAEIEVRIRIAEGWHLYGENPDAEFVSPTTLSAEELELLETIEIVAPPGNRRFDEVAKQELVIYEAEAIFLVKLQIRSDAVAEKTILRLPFQFQACDQSRCLAPQKTVLEIPLEIAAE